MKSLQYIKLNIKHYSATIRQAHDELAITFLSRKKYARITPPAWDNSKIVEILSQESLLSKINLPNNNSIENANRILNGELCLFGKTISSKNKKVQWHKDYLSGHEYKKQIFSRYIIKENTGIDIIIPWTISQFQFTPTLIQAYQTSKDIKYSNYFYDILRDWETENKYLFGVNWICGLDIAIRALNIALGLIYFKDVEHPYKSSAVKLLWAHLIYIQKRDLYLQKTTVNNHQLVAALLHYGLLHLFDPVKTKVWRDAAHNIVSREMERQFHHDGGNFESALQYHQFVLEAAYISTALVAGNKLKPTLSDRNLIPNSLADRLSKATKFTASYSKIWGGNPQIGDSSDGRILFHKDYFSWTPDNTSYIADWSRLTFLENDPYIEATNGGNGQIFPETGLGLYSTVRYGAIFAAMPISENAAGHNHLDKGSIILKISGIPVFVDSGTYCYTSDTSTRYTYRESRAHNVMIIGKHDQAKFQKYSTFSTPVYGALGISIDHESPEVTTFNMWHDGYCRFKNIGRVTRQISCTLDNISIRDIAEGEGEEFIELIYNIHPNISIDNYKDYVLLSHSGLKLCEIHPAPGWEIGIEAGLYSPRYATHQSCVRIIISKHIMLPIDIETKIKII